MKKLFLIFSLTLVFHIQEFESSLFGKSTTEQALEFANSKVNNKNVKSVQIVPASYGHCASVIWLAEEK